MSAVKTIGLTSVEDYLKRELTSEAKHELIDGHVYAMAMAGTSANHERISVNILRKFGNHLENNPCEPFGSDMKLRVNSNFFYPDAMVDCNFDNSEPYFTKTPVIIFEVLAKSTRRKDTTIKFMSYINIPGLEEYVMVEQDIADVQIFRRREGWLAKHYFLGDEITFESIGLTLSVEDIYHRVQNDDMAEFLNNTAGQ
ncbi:Uma2 family endonuclease [Methylovulum psychrotolerans]|uniref:Uma2 family endonuclease n=1 Tax=Methylovulum psychrotolerans TaxID=1704499 RepID=A0A2S5CPL4_9GAMM|nr:Uma2 family endonuclease [Methylovulum psychrotolerans]POZ52750.1 Uma2 family endonuclease [Methylovulum psychrotolerans]